MATEAEKRAAYYAENSHKWRDVYSKTPERKAYEKDYYSKEEVRKHRKEYMKAYRLANMDKWRKKRTPEQSKADYARTKERMSADPCFKIRANLRIRLYHAVTGRSKSVSAVGDLGCTVEELRTRLESQFSGDMSWDNYGSLWTIDHIYPLSKANLMDEVELKAVCHHSNLRPILKSDNSRKGDAVDEEAECLFASLKTLVFASA